MIYKKLTSSFVNHGAFRSFCASVTHTAQRQIPTVFWAMTQITDIIDGKKIAQEIRNEIKGEIAQFDGRAPGLAVVLVGERTDSATYVRMKLKACEAAGIKSVKITLPEDVSQDELLSRVHTLNEDESMDGILVQLPLPSHIKEVDILEEISPLKDVDGLHPANVGDFVLNGLRSRFIPCTPKGCVELLIRSGHAIEGKHAVVLGRSNIVGKPISTLLLAHNATVTTCHSKTRNLSDIVRRADILIAAIGRPKFVQGDWLKPGCVVIDVGINSVDDSTKKRGYRLVGDVDFEAAQGIAGAITPVPGGVGPMTIAMLLRNTVDGYKRTTNQI